MDKAALAALALVGLAVCLGTYQILSGCASSTVEATEEGQNGRETCERQVVVTPFVLLAFMALAGLGVALGRAAVAWSGAVLAVGGCAVFGLSWGGLLFYNSLGVVLAVTVWHLWGASARPRMAASTLAVVLSLPLGLFGAFALATGIPVLFEPCREWDDTDHTVQAGADGCRSRTSGGDISRGEYAFQLVSQQALSIAAFGMAVAGAWRRSGAVLLAAGIAWCLVAVAWTLGFGLPFIPLAILAAVACLAAAWRSRGARPPKAAAAPSPP